MPVISRRALTLAGCLFLLYASWGSLFLGNKIALEYFSGFLLSGLRFTIAGFTLLTYTYLRREKSKFTWHDIKYNFINGFFLVTVSSGFVAKAQENVPSGMAAILFGAAPIWLMLSQWLLWGGKKPTVKQSVGLLLGFCALIWLNVHQGIQGDVSIFGLFLILLASISWVVGTRISQTSHGESSLSIIRTSGLLLLIGGLQTLVFSLIFDDEVNILQLPIQAYLALAYLSFFSSIVGYTTYLWLLFNSRAIVAMSYEYVTPAVGVALGTFFAGEYLDITIILLSIVLVFSVFLITTHDRQ